MTQIQEPYNLFAMQKRQNYPSANQGAQNTGTQQGQGAANNQQGQNPGNVQGETVDQFVQGKQATNSGYGNQNGTVNVSPSIQNAEQPVTTPSGTQSAQVDGSVNGIAPGESGNQSTKSGNNKPITNMDELAQAMGYTSPQEEERLRKASLTNQRIMAIGDALRHIGNLYYTINGATPQKYNSPVLEEEQRYLRGKAMRDKANHTYLTYKQAKDKQDQQAKQWEAQFNYNMAKDAANYQLNKDKADAYARNQDALAALNKAKQDGVISENQYKALRNEWFPKQQEANLARTKAQTAAAYTRASNDTRRTNAYVNKMNNSGSGGSRGTKTSNGKGGYVYSTKNGYVELDKDYLSKNKINKSSLVNTMKQSGAIDDEWMTRYNRLQWDTKAQDEMLDDAVSDWLMNDDTAEEYMVNHLKGQSSRTEKNSKTDPYGDRSGSKNHKNNPYG